MRLAIVLAAVLVLADGLLWLAGTRVLAAQTSAWIARQQAGGWTITTDERAAGGGPFCASLIITRAAIAGGEHIIPGGLTWSADRVVLSIRLLHPFTLTIAAEGQQFLRLSHAPDLGFVAGHEWVELPLLTGGQGYAVLDAQQVSGGIEGSRHPQDVQLDRLSLRARQMRAGDAPFHEDGWRLDVRASAIGLPDIGYWPLGATVNEAGAVLVVALPHASGLTAGGGVAEGRAAAEAAAWRDGGGSVAVRDANLLWGPLAVRGQADLQLDADLQPAGRGTLDVAGTRHALEAAAGAGLISPGLATTASAVLAVMSHVTLKEDGREDADAVRLPFRLRESTLSVGEIPIVRLQPIGWGRPKPS